MSEKTGPRVDSFRLLDVILEIPVGFAPLVALSPFCLCCSSIRPVRHMLDAVSWSNFTQLKCFSSDWLLPKFTDFRRVLNF